MVAPAAMAAIHHLVLLVMDMAEAVTPWRRAAVSSATVVAMAVTARA
jgi:hypothetical protein